MIIFLKFADDATDEVTTTTTGKPVNRFHINGYIS